jgi:hypothetical protein
MVAELTKILKAYAVFEIQVRTRVAELCAPFCSVCKSACCRPEYCRETIDSPFLTLLRSKALQNTAYDAKRGWLTPTGCALSAGRPPVCYQFNCKKIIDSLPDDYYRYLLGVLSEMVAYVGKRAIGTRHLVEAVDATELERLNADRIRKRIGEARIALGAIQSFAGNGSLSGPALEVLKKIKPRPASPVSRTRKFRCIKHN